MIFLGSLRISQKCSLNDFFILPELINIFTVGPTIAFRTIGSVSTNHNYLLERLLNWPCPFQYLLN